MRQFWARARAQGPPGQPEGLLNLAKGLLHTVEYDFRSHTIVFFRIRPHVFYIPLGLAVSLYSITVIADWVCYRII